MVREYDGPRPEKSKLTVKEAIQRCNSDFKTMQQEEPKTCGVFFNDFEITHTIVSIYHTLQDCEDVNFRPESILNLKRFTAQTLPFTEKELHSLYSQKMLQFLTYILNIGCEVILNGNTQSLSSTWSHEISETQERIAGHCSSFIRSFYADTTWTSKCHKTVTGLAQSAQLAETGIAPERLSKLLVELAKRELKTSDMKQASEVYAHWNNLLVQFDQSLEDYPELNLQTVQVKTLESKLDNVTSEATRLRNKASKLDKQATAIREEIAELQN